MSGPYWRPAWTSYFDDFEFDDGTPDLAANSLTWNSAQGGVDFGYAITGADLTQPAKAGLYWSPSPAFDPATATLAYETTIASAQGNYGPIHVSPTDLGQQPAGATNLLLVLDAAQAIQESDETNNVLAVPIPSIDLAGAATTNEGAVYALTLGHATYPAENTITGYTVHWGDGQTSSVAAADLPADRTVTHTYADGAAGGTPETITVDVTDATGTYAALGTKSITVANVAPTPSIDNISTTRVVGTSITATGSATDPAGSNDTLTYTWQAFNLHFPGLSQCSRPPN